MAEVFHYQGTVDAFQPTAAGGTPVTFDMYAPEGVLKQRQRKRFVNPGRSSYTLVWSPSVWWGEGVETWYVPGRETTWIVPARETTWIVPARETTWLSK